MPVDFDPALAGMEPQAVASVGGQPAWAVGLPSAVVGKRVPLIARWTGDSWQKVPSPFSAYGILNSVAARTKTDAWAAGASGSYTRWPISSKWNGTNWATKAVPRPAGAQSATLTDLALVDASRLWAAGAMLVNGREKPLIVKRHGGTWKYLNPVIPADAEGGLTDVTIAPGGKVWAAGWLTDASGGSRAWVVVRNSAGWQTSPLDIVPAGRAAINDVSFSTANDGWATGFVEMRGGYQPILQHWNGVRWSNWPLPWAAGRSVIPFAVEPTDGGVALGGMEVDRLRRDVLAISDAHGWHVSSLANGGTMQVSAMYDLAPVTGGVIATGPIDRQPASAIYCSASASAVAEQPASEAITSADTLPPSVDGGDRPTSSAPPDDHPLAPAVALSGTVAVDMTNAAGLGMVVPTWSGVIADFNTDGHPDLFVNRHFGVTPLLLLGSSSGVFNPMDADFQVVDRHDCATADVDRDGTLDMFCAIGDNKGTTNTPDELLLDVADRGGDWSSRAFDVMDGFGRGRDVAFLDLDGDPYPDLYVSSEPSRADAMWSSNRLFRNDGGTSFEPAPSWGLDHATGFGVAVAADLDGDGDDDLLLDATEHANGLAPGARAFIHDTAQFVDRTASLNLVMPNVADMDVADFDGDGVLDVVQLSNSQLRVMLRRGGAFQAGYVLDVNGGVALGIGDVSGDGKPDIYVARRTQGNSGHLMLVNGGDGSSFTSITIPQPGQGSADDVLAVDYDGNGRTDFVTLNGWSFDGPVKLTAFFPQP